MGHFFGYFRIKFCRPFYKTPNQFLHNFVVLTVYCKTTRARTLLNSFFGRSNPVKNHNFGQNHDFIEDLFFCSSENQNTKLLKVVGNSREAVVLSSKAAAYNQLISERKPGHKVRGICKIWEILLYCLTRRKIILSVPICRVSIVVYIHKIS